MDGRRHSDLGTNKRFRYTPVTQESLRTGKFSGYLYGFYPKTSGALRKQWAFVDRPPSLQSRSLGWCAAQGLRHHRSRTRLSPGKDAPQS